jgi:hypothetical protein
VFRWEHRRRYPTQGRYPYPVDDKREAHLIAVWLWRETLQISFPEPTQRVIDVGTGLGDWAQEYADENPYSEVIGVDFGPWSTWDFTAPNCIFRVDDYEKRWTWKTPFNFIHLGTECCITAGVVQEAFR